KRYFTGLPCPSAAATIAGFVWLGTNYGFENASGWMTFFSTIITLYVAIMMVSSIKFRSFKDLDVKARGFLTPSLIVVLLIAIIFLDPSKSLFIIFMVYALSGLVGFFLRNR
ncbi:MAG: CDP-alcohol phosphatidyltransferase family protein, partial [Francisellaceae bacterium]